MYSIIFVVGVSIFIFDTSNSILKPTDFEKWKYLSKIENRENVPSIDFTVSSVLFIFNSHKCIIYISNLQIVVNHVLLSNAVILMNVLRRLVEHVRGRQ